VLSVRTSDRFGDNGLVGALFLRRSGDLLSIENFVLSCRVFSRGVEQACLAAVLGYARSAKVRAVSATYKPSKRNGGVADFYPRHGFVAVPHGESEELVLFDHDLTAELAPPEHVHLSVDPELAAARGETQ
jgi:predicted enzyme involved in methoxymalonyl-ACP biosynthesis